MGAGPSNCKYDLGAGPYMLKFIWEELGPYVLKIIIWELGP